MTLIIEDQNYTRSPLVASEKNIEIRNCFFMALASNSVSAVTIQNYFISCTVDKCSFSSCTTQKEKPGAFYIKTDSVKMNQNCISYCRVYNNYQMMAGHIGCVDNNIINIVDGNSYLACHSIEGDMVYLVFMAYACCVHQRLCNYSNNLRIGIAIASYQFLKGHQDNMCFFYNNTCDALISIHPDDNTIMNELKTQYIDNTQRGPSGLLSYTNRAEQPKLVFNECSFKNNKFDLFNSGEAKYTVLSTQFDSFNSFIMPTGGIGGNLATISLASINSICLEYMTAYPQITPSHIFSSSTQFSTLLVHRVILIGTLVFSI